MKVTSPNIEEQIVCLADSRKHSGRCIAGKRTQDKMWVRPVSQSTCHEISDSNRQYQNGSFPRLLDIIHIPLVSVRPAEHQTENMLIDCRFYWEKRGKCNWETLLTYLDQDVDLWANGYSSCEKVNDRVPNNRIDTSAGSLRLIYLNEVFIHVERKAPNFCDRICARASFNFQDYNYKLDLTDIEIEEHCKKHGIGTYRLNHAVACISLALLHSDGYAYKLVASLITKERAGS